MKFNRRQFGLFLGTLAGTITLDWLQQKLPVATAQVPPADNPDPADSGSVPAESVAPAPSLDPPPATLDWFALKESGQTNWKLVTDPTNPLQATLEVKTPVATQGKPKQIFVLFPKQSPAYDTAMDTILGVFYNKNIPAVFTLVNFDKDDALGDQALQTLRGGQYDLAFSMGSESTVLFHKHFTAGETIPVVSVCSKDPVLMGQMKDYERGSGTNMAFTSLNLTLDVQMNYLEQLRPDLTNIVVMYDRQNKSSIETQVKPLQDIVKTKNIEAEKKLKEGKKANIIKIIEVVTNDTTAQADLEVEMPKALEQLRERDPRQQNSLFWITGSTAVFKEIETINRLSDGVPVLSVVPDVVKEGENSAVMAIGISFESNAYLAAVYALKILQDKQKPGDLPVGVVTPPDLAINFAKARKIDMKVPFEFFETASFVYDQNGKIVRERGKNLTAAG